MRVTLIGLFLGVLLFQLACSRPTSISFPGIGPIQEFRRSEHWLSVYGSKSARLSDLIDLALLSPYHPGLSVRAAIAKFGDPIRSLPYARGATYVEYMNEAGRFRIGSEESSSESVSYPLYFYPNDRTPANLLRDIIVTHLRPEAPKETIMLYQCGYSQPAIVVVIEGGQVDEVVWSAPRDVLKRSDENQCTE